MMYARLNALLISCLLAVCLAELNSELNTENEAEAWVWTGSDIVWTAQKIELADMSLSKKEMGKLIGSRQLQVHPAFKTAYDALLERKTTDGVIREQHKALFNLPKSATVGMDELRRVTVRGSLYRDAKRYFKRCFEKCRDEMESEMKIIKMFEDLKPSTEAVGGFNFLKETNTTELLSKNISQIAEFWGLLETLLNPFYSNLKYFQTDADIKSAELSEPESEAEFNPVNYLKSCMVIKSCTKASYPKELLGTTDAAKQMRSKVKSCYTGWQTKCINLVKAIRYQILSKHLGTLKESGKARVNSLKPFVSKEGTLNNDTVVTVIKIAGDNIDVRDSANVEHKGVPNSILTPLAPGYLKNDAKEPEKLIKHMKEHDISLQEIFRENTQNVVDTYEKMLEAQSGSNVDDYNDMGTLQKIAVTAFEDLYKLAEKVDPKTAQMYEETKNAIDTFRTLFEENHRRIVQNKADLAEEQKRKKAERELRRAPKAKKVSKPKRKRQRINKRKAKKPMTLKQLDAKLTKKFDSLPKNEHKNLDLFKDWMRETHAKNVWPDKTTTVSALGPFLTKYLETE